MSHSEFHDELILDSINFIENIIDVKFPNIENLPALQREYLVANKDHLIFSLNNETSESLTADLTDKIQACLFKVNSYLND